MPVCVKLEHDYVSHFAVLSCAGLIHANHGEKVVDYLSQELRSNSSEVIQSWCEEGVARLGRLHDCLVCGGCMFVCRLFATEAVWGWAWLPWELKMKVCQVDYTTKELYR